MGESPQNHLRLRAGLMPKNLPSPRMDTSMSGASGSLSPGPGILEIISVAVPFKKSSWGEMESLRPLLGAEKPYDLR